MKEEDQRQGPEQEMKVHESINLDQLLLSNNQSQTPQQLPYQQFFPSASSMKNVIPHPHAVSYNHFNPPLNSQDKISLHTIQAEDESAAS